MLIREHPKKPRGLADLLNWGVLVDEGLVVNKDGTFLAGWSFRGPDLFSATPAEADALAAHVNRALFPLGNDWVLHVDAIRAPVPDYPTWGEFPDPVTQAIDDERRRAYEASPRFNTRFVLTATFVPPQDAERRAARFLLTGGPASDRQAVDWRREIGHFKKSLDDLEDLLSARLWVERLDSGDLLSHLHFCLTGLDYPIEPPPPGAPHHLDHWLASADFYGGFHPRVGRHHLAPVALRGLPHQTTPGALDFLSALPLPFRFSTRWLPLDPHTAERHIRRVSDRWFQKRRSLGDHLRSIVHKRGPHVLGPEPFSNLHAARMADDADQAVAEASEHRVRYGYLTSVVLLHAERRSTLERHTREVTRELRNHGFPAQLETVNAIEAYRGTLPGHAWPNLRRPLVHTRNLADLLPLTTNWSGPEHIPSPYFQPQSPPLAVATSGSTPFRLSLWSSDVGSTLVIGPTGSGKSTLLGLLVAQFFRYPGSQVFFFDKGHWALPLVLAAGGKHYDVGAEIEPDVSGPEDAPGDSLGKVRDFTGPSLTFQPLARIHSTAERAWAAEWLETLFALQGFEFTPRLRHELHVALTTLASLDPRERTLTDLRLQLQDHTLRDALTPYTREGLLGHLLNASEDALEDARFQVFETSALVEMREKVLVPVLLYLFHAIERRLDGRPTLLVLDEAWTFLLNSLFAQRLETWLREMRKKNAAVLFATQSLAEIRRSDQRHLLWESCPTKIFLPNPEAQTEETARLYREIGLNAREREVLARATPKREYYFTSPEGRRLLDFELGPLALAFLGATDRESLREIRSLAGACGPEWWRLWLEARGLQI